MRGGSEGKEGGTERGNEGGKGGREGEKRGSEGGKGGRERGNEGGKGGREGILEEVREGGTVGGKGRREREGGRQEENEDVHVYLKHVTTVCQTPGQPHAGIYEERERKRGHARPGPFLKG